MSGLDGGKVTCRKQDAQGVIENIFRSAQAVAQQALHLGAGNQAAATKSVKMDVAPKVIHE